MIISSLLMRIGVRVLFYPTLFWNRLLNRFNADRKWWDWIDEHVLLGALPGSREVRLLKELGVGAVINTCEEYCGPLDEYRHANIEQLYIPTVDYTPPTLKDIVRGVEFIHAQIGQGKKVYIHCKAGRGRSATVAICYLISKGYSPNEAQNILLSRRRQVLATIYQREVVQEYARQFSPPRA